MVESVGGLKRTASYKPPVPVDRGWAWLIMVASYVNLIVAVGLARSLSVFLPEILGYYQQPAAVTTLAFGLGDLSWMSANVAIPTVLLPRFGVRVLALSGSFLHCLTVIALAYSPNIIVFNCIFAVIGFADCLMIVPPLIHVGHFFKKRLSLANGVIHAGGSTAAVFIPQLAQFLLEKYGFQGALLILAGISFNSIASSMLLRPLSMYDNPKSTAVQVFNSFNGDPRTSLELEYIQLPPQEVYDTQDKEYNSKKLLFIETDDTRNKKTGEVKTFSDFSDLETKNGSFHHGLTNEQKKKEFSTYSEASLSESGSKKSFNSEIEEAQSLLPKTSITNNVDNESNNNKKNSSSTQLYKNDIGLHFHTPFECVPNNSEEDINKLTADSGVSQTKDKLISESDYRSAPLLSQKVTNTLSQEKPSPLHSDETDKELSHDKEKDDGSSCRCCSLSKIKATLSSSVLSNPVAVMLIVAGGLSTPGGNMYLPVLGLENGLSSDEVPWMLTIIGVSDIVGKLGFGFFADLGYLRPIRIVCFTQLTVGMTCHFTMFYKGFGPMAAMATIFGLTAGIIQSLLSSMIIEMIGLQYLAPVISFYQIGLGMGTFILNVSVGAIRDATGSFQGGFNLLGGMMLTSFVILLLEPLFIRCRDRGIHSRKLHKKSPGAHSSSI